MESNTEIEYKENVYNMACYQFALYGQNDQDYTNKLWTNFGYFFNEDEELVAFRENAESFFSEQFGNEWVDFLNSQYTEYASTTDVNYKREIFLETLCLTFGLKPDSESNKVIGAYFGGTDFDENIVPDHMFISIYDDGLDKWKSYDTFPGRAYFTYEGAIYAYQHKCDMLKEELLNIIKSSDHEINAEELKKLLETQYPNSGFRNQLFMVEIDKLEAFNEGPDIKESDKFKEGDGRIELFDNTNEKLGDLPFPPGEPEHSENNIIWIRVKDFAEDTKKIIKEKFSIDV
ncbi:hypothetical protein [Francisella sp. SYW-2]|uniref:hypothetical protein n=1 Tax=Francisella sp. SYW-2 TaxID=2610886 RepID=UPI00123D0BC1|nr:hypothetical protein [Francisella sp. SYW-2]